MEIYSRAKRTDRDEWVYGFYVVSRNNLPKNKIMNMIQTLDSSGHFGCLAEVDPSTVGMCSGKRDCKDQRIWQGDYIETGNGDKYIIDYDESLFTWICKSIENPSKYYMLASLGSEAIRVIGNRIDTPGGKL